MTTHFALIRPALASFGILASNTAAQNSAAFAQLEVSLVGQTVDLMGSEIPVTSIPSKCRYVNGWFIVPNATGVLVGVPALDTVQARQAQISPGERYEAWPQDSAHFYRGSIWQPFPVGTTHKTELELKIGVSDDRGQQWKVETPTLPVVAGFPNVMTFSAGVVRGQQLMIVRYTDVDFTTHRHKLMGRRLFEFTYKTGITVTSTTNTWTFGNTGDWGLKVGDQFVVRGWEGPSTIGGRPMNELVTFTVIAAANTTVTVTRTGATAEGPVTGNMVFEPVQGNFSEITFGGAEFGDAVLTAAGLTPGVDATATLFHSFAARDDISAGGFYVGLHGGGHGTGSRVAFVQSVLHSNAATRVVAWVRSLSVEGIEPTVTYKDGWLYGTIRSQSGAGYPLRVWRSSDNLDNAPVLIDGPTNAGFARRQPAPLEIIGNQAFLFFAGERPTVPGAKDVALYVAVAPVAQVRTATSWPFRIYRVGAAYFSSTNKTAGTTVVGMCSAVPLSDRKLFVSWGTENGPLTFDQDGQPEVWGAVLDVSRWVGLPPVTDAIGHLAVE
jgi:hypothetical protein